jgi:hypothetical protein
MKNNVLTNSVIIVIPDYIDLFSEENIPSRKLVTSEIFSKRKPQPLYCHTKLIRGRINFAANFTASIYVTSEAHTPTENGFHG